MSKKILAVLAVLSLSTGIVQASSVLFTGAHAAANEFESYMFDNSVEGNVDIVADTGAVGFDMDMTIWQKVTGSSVVGQPGDADWALIKWAPAAARYSDLTISTNIYGIEMFGHISTDPNATGISDPGETLNLSVGTYLLYVTGVTNYPISSILGGELLSDAVFRNSEHRNPNRRFNDPYSINVTGAGVSEVSAVPVPAAVWLFGSALAGLGAVRRKKVVV